MQHTMFTNHLEKSHLVDSREIVLARNMFLDSFSGGEARPCRHYLHTWLHALTDYSRVIIINIQFII